LRFFAQFFLSNSVILVRLVLILTGGKNGNQTTEIIRNETRYKMMVEMVQFNFGEKHFEFMAQFRGACTSRNTRYYMVILIMEKFLS